MSMVMTDMAPAEGWTFGGVETLNGTQIPDAYFDEVMAPLGPSAFTVLMYVSRRTFGFKRHSDQISLDQICHGIVTSEVRDAGGAVIKPARRLDHGTGLAKSTVVRALDRLIAAGLIHKRHNTDPQRGQLANTYGIIFKDPAAASPATPALPDHKRAPVQETASPLSSPVSQGDTPCRVMTQAPVRHLDTQQTVETTNSQRHTDISKRAPRVRRQRPSLDSTDSMILPTKDTAAQTLGGHAVSPVDEHVARLSAELGDDAPRASRTRVFNMQGAAGLDAAAMVALLDEAAAITRSQAVAITKRGRAGEVVRMPYLLATLRGLVDAPASDTGGATLAWPPALDLPAIAPVAAVAGVDDVPPAGAAGAMAGAGAVWQVVRDELRRDLTPENYARWVEATMAVELDGDLLRVGVPDETHRQWLEHKLRGCVERALGHAGHVGVRIAYDIAPVEDTRPPVVQTVGQAVDKVVAFPALSPTTALATPAPAHKRQDAEGVTCPSEAPPAILPSVAVALVAPLSTTVSSSATLACDTPVAPSDRHPPSASIMRSTVASIAVPPALVACPICRVTPCRCRPAERVRRVVAGHPTLAWACIR